MGFIKTMEAKRKMTKKTMGIDVDSKSLVCCIVINEDKSTAIWKTFKNREKDFSEIIKYIRSQNVSLVLMEASGGYEQKISIYLSANNISVYVVNPRRARNFARGIGLNYKNDKVDAFALGHMAQVVKLPPVTKSNPNQLKLKRLVVRRLQIKGNIRVERNRKILADEEIEESILKHIKFMEDEVKEIEDKINNIIKSDKVMQAKKKVMINFIGIGNVTAAAMLALIPELGYISNKKISSLAGLAPMARDSGQIKGKRFISGGRGNARKSLYMPAWVAVRKDPGLKIVYERHLDKGKMKKVAIVAIMRKLLVRINAALRNHIEAEEKVS
jgi:transposase